MSARSRDRRVYLRSHPLLFALLSATRRRPLVRLGRTVLVHDPDAYREILARVPLDRTADRTTGGAATRLTTAVRLSDATSPDAAISPSTAVRPGNATSRSSGARPGDTGPPTGGSLPTDAARLNTPAGRSNAGRPARGGLLFDQDGAAHRVGRRDLAAALGSAGTAALRPVWQEVLDRGLSRLPDPVDLVPLAAELSGATVAALTGSTAEPLTLARAALTAAAAAAHEHLPGPRPRRNRNRDRAEQAARELTALLPDPLDAMLAVAAVNTTVAALPRAAAWCARDRLWDQVSPELAVELLRLTAPSPILPRVAAAEATVAGHPVRPGDRLILVARHAAESHRDRPRHPSTAAQAVFGTGPHACPGARLARAQLTDLLAALAPHRPTVRRAVPARRTALPGYASLVVAAL